VSTGQKVSAEISTTGVKPKPPLDLARWERAEGAKRFRPAIRKAEKLIAEENDEGGDLAILIRQIKEALLLNKGEQAEALRDELLELLEAMK
jgi:hypothetical protein